MAPCYISNRVKSIFTSLLLLLLSNLFQTTQATRCNGAPSSTADLLADAIFEGASNTETISWHIHVTIPSTISGLDDDTRASFDVPFLLLDDTDESDHDDTSLIAVFHTPVGATTAMATYIAHATVPRGTLPPAEDGWTVTAKLTSSGSMGYLYQMEHDERIFFAYERHDYEMGNTAGVRLYENLGALLAGGGWEREVRLQRAIALPTEGGSVTTEKNAVRNIGTPSITNVVEEDVGTVLHFRFHYYPLGGSLDYPGVGHITFPPSGTDSTIVSEYDIWYGRFENKVNNAMRISGAVGKIGMRAHLGYPGLPPSYLLYEGQMADAGEGYIGWLSWRPILYEMGCDAPVGAVLPLTLPTDLQTLTNPRVALLGGGYMLFSFFVPSEVFDEDKTDEYEGYDPERCPTCAMNPMEVAKSPARSGSVLVLVNLGTNRLDDE